MAENQGFGHGITDPGRLTPAPAPAPQVPPEPAAGQPPPAEPAPLTEEQTVRQVVRTLIGFIGINSRVDVESTPSGYLANIRSRRSGLLIGPRGSTLRAIQHLARMIVRRSFPDVPAITVDVGGYRERRDSFLCKKGLAVARIVIETGREMAVDLLTESEMTTIHDALLSLPEVRVYAVGTGPRRTVVIAPALPAGPEAKPRPRG